MQNTIAITAGALILSLAIVVTGNSGLPHLKQIAAPIAAINFENFLLKGVLGFLLFAGGLGVKLNHLKDQKWEIAGLSVFSTLISTFLIGYALFFICQSFNIQLALIHCLLFGALISPTDPIAVLAIVKKIHAPQRISTQIEGESLFNDALGLIIFTTIFGLAFSTQDQSVVGVFELFLQESIGGILYGFCLGLIFHYLIKSTNDHSTELLMTLIIPTTGYIIADYLHVSGPLAMVVCGIMIGNWTRFVGFSKESVDHLDRFWMLMDELLNSLLFLLIGLTLVNVQFHREDWLLMLIAIPLVLAARYLSVRVIYFVLERFRHYNIYSVKVLTWGGLRGGLALALAMSIPSGIPVIPEKNIDVREILVLMTYAVVVFSILVQGSTITPLIKKAKTWRDNHPDV